VRYAGCSRVLAISVSGLLLFCLTFLFTFTVGMGYITKFYDLYIQLTWCILPSCRQKVYFETTALMLSAAVPLALYALAMITTSIVGMTRSQAHLGHVIFGFQVVNATTGKPAGFAMTMLRNYFLLVMFLAVVVFAPNLLQKYSVVINLITYVINPIMVRAFLCDLL
jgi:hypothetical protein